MVSDQSVETIFHYHELKFGESFPKQNNKCCNIFGKHNKEKKKKKAVGLIAIMVETATLLRNKGFQAVDRKTLCRHSYDVAKQIEVSSDERSDGNNDENDETSAAYDEQEKKEDMLNESLNIFDVSPIKTHNMSKKSQASSNLEKIERSFKKQKMVAADVLQVHSPEFQSGSNREVQSKAGYLDLLLFLIKEKLSITTMKNSEKIQLMFLAPGS